MPSMMLLKGSAPCPYSFPGSVLCSYSVILHPWSVSVSPLRKFCPFVSHYHKQIPWMPVLLHRHPCPWKIPHISAGPLSCLSWRQNQHYIYELPAQRIYIAVRHFDRRNSHAFANQLFHRSFTMRFLCFLPAVVQIHPHCSLQDVGIQFSGLNYKSDCFLRYFLLHKYLRSAFPCAYAPLRWNIQPM